LLYVEVHMYASHRTESRPFGRFLRKFLNRAKRCGPPGQRRRARVAAPA
jgi:hypothetical protein